jgi:hypothetical protein
MSKKGTLTWPIKLCSVNLRACLLHWTGDPNSGFCQLLLCLLLPWSNLQQWSTTLLGVKAPWRPSSAKIHNQEDHAKSPTNFCLKGHGRRSKSLFFSLFMQALDNGDGHRISFVTWIIKEHKIHAKLKVSNWSFQLTEKGSIASPLNPKPSMHKDDIKRISKDVLQAH